MDLAGGVDVAGVLLITVGHLAVAAAERCTRGVTPATVPLVVLPEQMAFSLQNAVEQNHYIYRCILKITLILYESTT